MKKLLLLISGIVFLVSGTAYSTPIPWDSNSNRYDVILLDHQILWEDAKTAAEKVGGHLVTITSEAENEFVWSLVSGKTFTSYWLGGYQENPGVDEVDPAGGWRWVTDEHWSDYNNWYPNEPNNGVGGTQHYLHFWPELGYWDDMHNAPSMKGYIVEYESATVPEPATMLLLGAGLAGLAGFSRKKFRKKK